MSKFSIQKLIEHTQNLSERNDKTQILLEFINYLYSIVNINSGVVFLTEDNNLLRLEIKIGLPDEWINFEQLSSLDINQIKDFIFFNERQSFQSPQLKKFLLKKYALEKNIIFIPLGWQEKFLGLIILEHKTEELFSINLIKLAAHQTSLSLKYALAYEELEKLDQVALVLNSSLKIKATYPLFIKELKKLVEFDRLTITIPDKEKKELLVYAEFEKGSTINTKVPLNGSAPAIVINTSNYLIEDDLAVLKLFHEDDQLYTLGHRTALRLPLISKGNVIGTLNVSSKKPSAYEQKHINLLTALCNRISCYVENALVFDVINKQLYEIMQEIKINHEAILEAFMIVLDAKDSGTKGHCYRVVQYTKILAEKLGISGEELDNMLTGALLHDIGKVTIPDAVLFKTGQLDDKEWEIIRAHPKVGYEIVSKIEFFKEASQIVLNHHERFDGKGYPEGLKGTEIPPGARIFAVADAFDAMTSDRPYRKGMALEDAKNELLRCSDLQFDPQVVEIFIDCFEEFGSSFTVSERK